MRTFKNIVPIIYMIFIQQVFLDTAAVIYIYRTLQNMRRNFPVDLTAGRSFKGVADAGFFRRPRTFRYKRRRRLIHSTVVCLNKAAIKGGRRLYVLFQPSCLHDRLCILQLQILPDQLPDEVVHRTCTHPILLKLQLQLETCRMTLVNVSDLLIFTRYCRRVCFGAYRHAILENISPANPPSRIDK